MGNEIAILVVLIFLSAFFSGVETALMSLNMIKVNSLYKQKKKGSAALYRIKQHPNKLIITILIGNNIVNIGAAALATVVFINLLGSGGVGVATGVMTFLILVFGEITPKTFASQNAERVSLAVARLIEILAYILSPLVKIFSFISRIMSKLLGSKQEKELSEEELKTIVMMGKEQGILTKESAKMVHNVLEFKGTKVNEIMTPKMDIEMFSGEKKIEDVIDHVVKTPYSIYPVYEGENKDKIIGILDVDDVLKCAKNQKLNVKVKSIAKPILFIPVSKQIDDLLTEFEGKDVPMAIVVNEYGRVVGLVTVQDILEEIVGEIFDEKKRASIYIKRISDKSVSIDGRAPIDEINEILQLDLPKERFNTIAGFVLNKLHKIPKKGDKVKIKRAMLIVDKATKQTVEKVRLVKD